MISAIEQGIITEQTKIRLKELETQISQYDFDIEQAKQRTYSYLTPELIKEFFQKAVCGDIESNGARKLIVRNFIREVILYKDKVVITFNFTDQHITKKRLPDSIEEVERTAKQAEKSASKNKSGVYKNASTPPTEPLKTQCFQGLFLFGENSFVSIFCVSVNFSSRFYALFCP